MLRRLRDLQAWTVETSDDRVVGRVDDFYFDDRRWTVRYIAVNVGDGFPPRQVLISILGIEGIDSDGTRIVADLTRENIRQSSSVGAWAAGSTPFRRQDGAEGAFAVPREENRLSLHSVYSVSGCHIQALDGKVGRVEDVIVDDDVWAIRYLAVDATQWIGGTMLVPPELIRRVDWATGLVHVNVAREDLKSSRPYHPKMDMEPAHEQPRHAQDRQPAYWVTQ